MKKDLHVDVAIIGAGTAGISAFKEASKITQNMVLIDHGPLGTTCARVGCMPSKVLIQAANYYHSATLFGPFGISHANKLSVNLRNVMQHVRRMRDDFTDGMIRYVKSLGNRFILGSAHFMEPNVLSVNNQKILAKKIIIATGSSSIIPKEWHSFSQKILTSENIFEETDFNRTMAVIGGGVIGLELGQALSRLGIKIDLFHSHPEIGGLSDAVINAHAIEIFAKEFSLSLGEKATVEYSSDQFIIENTSTVVKADQILAALGKKVNFESLDLMNIGICFDKRGDLIYDKKTLRIPDTAIYVAGDASHNRPLLHEAVDDGHIAGYNSVHDTPHSFARRTPLMILFSEPTIAIVGKAYKDLKKHDYIIGKINFADQGRAKIMMRNLGMLHIYAERSSGLILGAEMIAPDGEHLAHLLALAIQNNMTVCELLKMPFYHPTLQEGMRTALRELSDQVINKSKTAFDLASCENDGIGP